MSFIKDILTFIPLHLSRLIMSLILSYFMALHFRSQTEFVQGLVLATAVLPSLINIMKRYRRTFLKYPVEGLSVLFFILVMYVFACLDDAQDLSSTNVNRMIWQGLFIALGIIEFYACRRLKTARDTA